MKNTRAEAFAPATVANLGSGFDILGLAIGQPGDTVIATWDAEPHIDHPVRIIAITGDGGRLTHDPERNTAAIAAHSTLKLAGESRPVALTIHKGLPLASGLGSSAASAVAGALAVNELLGSPFSKADLLPACLDGEAAVSGYHADNVAPCLFGGITLSYGVTADTIQPLPVPPGLHLAFVTPNIEVPTAIARAVLPPLVPLKAMIAQTGAVARLIDALYRHDIPTLAAAMEADGIIEPARAHLMPHLGAARAVAKQAGALGLVISGAGPTLMAICEDAQTASRVAAALHTLYEQAGIGASTLVSTPSNEGARIIAAG